MRLLLPFLKERRQHADIVMATTEQNVLLLWVEIVSTEFRISDMVRHPQQHILRLLIVGNQRVLNLSSGLVFVHLPYSLLR